MNSFIRPLEGNNTLWRYFFSFLVMVGLFFFGSIVYVFMMLLTALLSPNIAFDVDTGMLTDSLADLFLTHIVYVFAIPGVWLGGALYPETPVSVSHYTACKNQLAQHFLWLYRLFLADGCGSRD